jgi:hypothetical protein
MPAIALTSDPPSTAPSEGANTPHLAVRAKQATGLRNDRPPRSGLGRNGVPSLRRFPTLALLASLVAASAFTAPPALALNPERHYEMVSPPYKGGYGANSIAAVSPDGESVAFFSRGVFSGIPSGFTPIDYLASRGSESWSTAPLSPPAELMPYVASQDVSSSLGSTLAFGKPGANEQGAFQAGDEEEFLQRAVGQPDIAEQWGVIGFALKPFAEGPLHAEHLAATYDGADPNFCHVFVTDANTFLVAEALTAKNGFGVIYELTGGCQGELPGLQLVGLNSENKLMTPSCGKTLGATGAEDRFNAISSGGKEAFFTSGVVEKASVCSGSAQLFVDVGGRTVEVSRPIAEECGGGSAGVPCLGAGSRAGATFAGASRDGSKVFFMTSGRLLEGEVDSSSKLYVARIGCGGGVEGEACLPAQRESVGVTSLVQASRTANAGEAAEVQGVVRVAPDGSRVYFVARGVLGAGANTEGQAPVKGADNLYVYDVGSDSVKFVAELCSGPGSSGPSAGAVADSKCPLELDSKKNNDTDLWASRVGEAQTAGVDGRYLVFSSFGRLSAGDTDTARDVYRYDSVSGVLERVSVGEAGYDANGNNNAGSSNSLFNATIAPGHWGDGSVQDQYEMDNRTVTEDGSRIVFRTADPLSSHAVNGLTNIYEWHKGPGDREGVVSLISTGSAEAPEGTELGSVVISEDGSNVFFVTSQGLVPGDTDGAPDIYDARLGDGFPVAAAPRQPCSGDACQGPLTNPAPLLVPGSVSQQAGENFPAPVTAITPKKATPRCSKGRKLSHGKCVKPKKKNKGRGKGPRRKKK